ncbi:MAG: hypothetical protein LBD84_05475 [Campylobacteraceae bacterium]|jgi:hypothetical protein|nr:hypothetical protein [Campylobacteraceae bacterium]
MKIFYNRLHIYFLAALFVLIPLKNLMFENSALFLVKININTVDYSASLALFASIIFIAISIFLLILTVYFARVFKTILPIIAFAALIPTTVIFFSKGSLLFFVPYLIMCLMIYAGILRRHVSHEAKYFLLNKRKVFLIALGAAFIVLALFLVFFSEYLAFLLLLSLVAAFLLLLFFKVSHVGKKWILSAALVMVFVCLALEIFFQFFDTIALAYIFLLPTFLLCYAAPLAVVVFLPFPFFQPLFAKEALLVISCAFFIYFIFYFVPSLRFFTELYLFMILISLELYIVLKLQQKRFYENKRDVNGGWLYAVWVSHIFISKEPK